jgi:hypothetical protein
MPVYIWTTQEGTFSDDQKKPLAKIVTDTQCGLLQQLNDAAVKTAASRAMRLGSFLRRSRRATEWNSV